MKKSTLIFLFLIVIVILSFIRLKPPSHIGYVFMDTYEDSPTIIETTSELWFKLLEDSKKGNYWCDDVRWLEVATMDSEGRYMLAPSLGAGVVTDRIAHTGSKSVELTIAEVPLGYVQVNTGLARYLRNSTNVIDGVYEISAWFYVPSGYNPYYVHVSIENRLRLQSYFFHCGVNPEDSEVVVLVKREGGSIGGIYDVVPLGTINFQYDSWFKLWIVVNTQTTTWTCGYESPIERKTFQFNQPIMVYDLHTPAFNIYATGHNLPGREVQKLYVDDFYVERVGLS